MTEVTDRIRKAPPQRFRRYSQYKDSGVEWLGEIPAHWEVRRLKFVTHTVAGQSPPSVAVTDRMDGTDGLPFLQGNAEFGPLSPKPQKVCDSAPKRAEPGDILLSVRAPVGAMNVADQPYGIGRGLCAIRPAAGLDRSFCFYEVMAMRPLLDAVATGSTYDAVTSSDVGDLLILLPHQGEQHAIADFLDRETAKIDGLVERKERLIQLLQEKRTALITRAVTRGLDPNVPVKDSGVEWLGEIPAHWNVKKLKHLTPGTTVGIVVTPSKYYVDEGVPCLRSLNVSGGAIDMEKLVFISESANELHRKSKIFCGDVVVVRTGQAGTAAVVPEKLDGANCIDLLIVRRSERVLSWFMYYYLNSRTAMSQATEQSVGAIQAHYNTSTLARLVVPEIPLDEQIRIVRYLDRETARIDALIAKVCQAIDLLKEFRTALISAAVTGKIDVREEAA